MDDPGTLIYVVFLAISLIAGWYRNRKKKEEDPIGSDGKSFDQDSTVKRAPSYDKAEIERAMAAKIQEDMQARARLQELVSNPDSKEKPIAINTDNSISKRKVKLDETEYFEEEERFDARKAFIYSEIFNAPYI